MVLLGFWAYVALPGTDPSASPLLWGLAVAATALLVALAVAGMPVLPPRPVRAGAALGTRARARRLPRTLDPDAAGRPRPRAPAAYPAVVPL